MVREIPCWCLPPKVSLQFVQISFCRHRCELLKTYTTSQASTTTAVACAILALTLPQLSVRKINNCNEKTSWPMSTKPLSPSEDWCPLLSLQGFEVSRHHCHSAELYKPPWPKTVPGEDDPDSKKINNTLLVMCEYSSPCPRIRHRLTVFRYSQTHTLHGLQFFKFEACCTYMLYFYFSITREFTSLASLGSIWCCQKEEGFEQNFNGFVAFLHASMIWNTTW